MNIRVVEFYQVYFQNNSFVNFIKNKNIYFDIFWFQKNRPEHLFFNKREIILQELNCFILGLIQIRSFRNKKIVCFGGHYSLLLITRLFGPFLGYEYHLYIYNFYLHELGNKKLIKKILHFLLNTKYSTIIVQSPFELNYYRFLSKNNVYFIPYCEDPDFALDESQISDSRYLFTGGYTNRDYDLIIECARLNPIVRFVVVVSKLNKDLKGEEMPDNITLYEDIDISTFNELMRKSYGVVIPLKENVGSSGQMLCLGAMKMSKPIIYCNISSINHYFSDNSFGIPYLLGDINSLNDAIRKLYSDDYDHREMGKKAYSHYIENFTLNTRNEMLLDLIMTQKF
jgi:glycosyltransferase involved in cell wall biosynthesis